MGQSFDVGRALDGFLLPSDEKEAWAVCFKVFNKSFAAQSAHFEVEGGPPLLRSAMASTKVRELALSYPAMATDEEPIGHCVKSDPTVPELAGAWWATLRPAKKGSRYCTEAIERADLAALRLYWYFYERYSDRASDNELTAKDKQVRMLLGPFNNPPLDPKFFQTVLDLLTSPQGQLWIQKQPARQGQLGRDLYHLFALIAARSPNADGAAAATARVIISNRLGYLRRGLTSGQP